MSTPATPVGATMAQRLRSGWLWLVVVAIMLALAALAMWPSTSPGLLDPGDAGSQGGRALAQVLRHNGVQITVVNTRSQVDNAAAGPDAAHTTLLWIGAPETSTGQSIESAPPTTFADSVYANLGAHQAAALRLPHVSDQSAPNPAALACTADVGQAHVLSGPVETFSDQPGWQPCFGSTADGFVLLQRGRLTLVSDAQLFSNDVIAGHDNAALALHLLGRQPHLLWYEPASTTVVTDEQGSDTDAALPSFFDPLANLVGATVLVTMLWRGRRLGRLVREHLPAEVPALETTLNRGRLYARAGDRGHSLAVLQQATRRRLMTRLGVPASDNPQRDAWDLAVAASRALPPQADADPHAIHRLLTDPSAASDAELTAVAQALLDLEKRITP